jgi:RHS repeat-associated protein
VRERISDGTNIVTKDYKYNKQNRLMEVTTNDLSANREDKQKFVYDNNGNQLYTLYEVTEKAVENSKAAFGMFISGQSYSGESAKTLFETNAVNTYNAFNQLIKTTQGDVEARYKYNGEGQRIEKIVVKNGNSKVTRYLRLGTDIAMEMDEKGDVLSKNVSGTALISREMGSNKYFLLYNGEGDVTAITDRAGTVVEKYYYDAFGNVLEQLNGAGQKIASGDSKNPLRYKGYEYDEETKRYYLGSRMYDPAIARFLQEDTYRGQLDDPLSLNLYAYCNNNPLVYDDPTGHAGKSTQAAKEKETKAITAQLEKNGKAWASASAKQKEVLHNSSDKLRADLVKCNEGNAVIKAYADAGGVKKVETTLSTGAKMAVTPDSIKRILYDENIVRNASITIDNKQVVAAVTTQGNKQDSKQNSSTNVTPNKNTGTVSVIQKPTAQAPSSNTPGFLGASTSLDNIGGAPQNVQTYINNAVKGIFTKGLFGDVNDAIQLTTGYDVNENRKITESEKETLKGLALLPGSSSLSKELKEGGETFIKGVLKNIDNKAVVKAAEPGAVINALSDFHSKKMVFGGNSFLIDKSGMKHILERHHPDFWDGSVKETQSFLNGKLSIEDVSNSIYEVMKQNRDILTKKGSKGMYQITGSVDGIEYVVGLKNGRIGQFYPK